MKHGVNNGWFKLASEIVRVAACDYAKYRAAGLISDGKITASGFGLRVNKAKMADISSAHGMFHTPGRIEGLLSFLPEHDALAHAIRDHVTTGRVADMVV
jgi:hypothetical protein